MADILATKNKFITILDITKSLASFISIIRHYIKVVRTNMLSRCQTLIDTMKVFFSVILLRYATLKTLLKIYYDITPCIKKPKYFLYKKSKI